MLIHLDHQRVIDTDIDLSAAERHVVQKLFGWKELVHSIEEFREKKMKALAQGWNQSGPLDESKAMTLLCQHLEKEIRLRLQKF